MDPQILPPAPDDPISPQAEVGGRKEKRKPVLGNRPFQSWQKISPTPGEQVEGRGEGLGLTQEDLRHQGEGP